jgi:hypothetical protein
MFVSDNGMELTSIAILRWSQETRIEWHCAPTSSSNTSWFAALHEAAIGPELPTCAMQQCRQQFEVHRLSDRCIRHGSRRHGDDRANDGSQPFWLTCRRPRDDSPNNRATSPSSERGSSIIALASTAWPPTKDHPAHGRTAKGLEPRRNAILDGIRRSTSDAGARRERG